jgi:hypothetical protein
VINDHERNKLLQKIADAQAKYDAAEAMMEDARQELRIACVNAMSVRINPVIIREHTRFTGSYLRLLAKDADIAPFPKGPVPGRNKR